MPQNIIRPIFRLSDDAKKQVADDILDYVAHKLGDDFGRALEPVVSRYVPFTLGPAVRHEIEIDQEKHMG